MRPVTKDLIALAALTAGLWMMYLAVPWTS